MCCINFSIELTPLISICEKCGMTKMYSLYVSKAKKTQNWKVCKYLCNFYLRCNMISIYIAPIFSQDKGVSSVNTINRNVAWLVNGLDFGLFAMDLCEDQHAQQNRLKQDRQSTYNVILWRICVPNVVMKTQQCLPFVLLLNLHIAVNSIKPLSDVMETLVWVPFALLSM